MFLGTLGDSLLGNIVAGKGVLRVGEIRKGTRFLIPPHSLTNFEIQRLSK